MNGADGDERHRRQSPSGKRATEPDGEGVSIMKDDVKQSSPSLGATELELVRLLARQ